MLDPIIVQIPASKIPVKGPRLPSFNPKWTKIITASIAIIVSASMILMLILTVLANNSNFKKTHQLDKTSQDQAVPLPSSGSEVAGTGLPGSEIAVGSGGTSGTDSPVVTLTAEPASVIAGQTSLLKWSVTKNPTSCVASEDWSGDKPLTGEEKTAPLSSVQTYLFTLTCKNATGTGFSTVSVGAIAQSSTGGTAAPVVTLAANPTSIFTGDSSTLIWSVTNSPSSCSASGDWSGAKATSGPENTGALSVAKAYVYTLTCKNSAGTGTSTATVAVTNPPPDVPIVTISSNPVGPVTPGTPVTVTWNATNNPTSCTASGDWSGSKNATGSQSIGALNTIKTYSFTIDCSNGAGGTFDSAAVLVRPNPPVVSLSVSPSTITTGSSSTITWNATNNPTSCTASGDWSGAKTGGGTVSTGTLNTPKTYLYSLSCTNQGGTGYANNIALTVSNPSAPVVTLTANPIAVTSGGSSTLTWSATNNPTSCTASGDWSGSKASSGTIGTGNLNTIKTYSYTLACTNAGGSNSSTSTVSVSSGGNPVSPPVVSISVAPSQIGTGSAATVSWSATNNPTSCTASNAWSGSKSASGSSSTGIKNTAGTFTYALSCTNSAGSGSSSAALTVIAVPVVSISLSPTAINTGSSSTLTWSATNSPSSCTASGSWSGSKGSSGSVSTGTISTPGTNTYTLSCSNAGGSGSNSATLTISNPGPVYCGGLSPCYGPNDLAGHASIGDCWGWNVGTSATWVINITSFRPTHKGGIKSGSTSTIENASFTCNHNIHSILSGTSGITGYKDSGGATTHGHNSSTINNSGSSSLNSYRVGYYDATKP